MICILRVIRSGNVRERRWPSSRLFHAKKFLEAQLECLKSYDCLEGCGIVKTEIYYEGGTLCVKQHGDLANCGDDILGKAPTTFKHVASTTSLAILTRST